MARYHCVPHCANQSAVHEYISACDEFVTTNYCPSQRAVKYQNCDPRGEGNNQDGWFSITPLFTVGTDQGRGSRPQLTRDRKLPSCHRVCPSSHHRCYPFVIKLSSSSCHRVCPSSHHHCHQIVINLSSSFWHRVCPSCHHVFV